MLKGNNVNLKKSIARSCAVELAPKCGEILADFRDKYNGWVKMPAEIELAYKGLGLGPYYVAAYEDENRILGALFKAVFPRNTVENVIALEMEFRNANEAEQLALLNQDELPSIEGEPRFSLDDFFPKTEEARKVAQARLDALSDDGKEEAALRLTMFTAFFYSFFHNILSIMVHGQKLTVLVQLALQGDKKAFCKAIQIDRNLLEGHPYFKETYTRLLSGEDKGFLDAVAYRIRTPTTQGRIEYPVLYALFAILESFDWLDGFTASELLDICDGAKLDRFQNRIEDENAVTKRRIEYRKFQKTPK